MGWIPGVDAAHQAAYDINYGRVLICFQIAYGFGFLFAGRIIDKLGTKTGYALAILIWGCASISHSLVASVAGFCIARIFLGLGESGNFPAAIKATTEWFPAEERALATGLFNSGSNASAFIAPVLIAAVTAKLGMARRLHQHRLHGTRLARSLAHLPLQQAPPRLHPDPGRPSPPSPRAAPSTSILFATAASGPSSSPKASPTRIWWFYLFYLPKFLNDNYGLDLNHVKYPLIVIYTAATVGSIAGGWLSGFRMKHGHTVNSGRKFALLVCAICVLPIMLVPHMGTLFPTNAWPAIGLFCLATAAHQGWSANLFSTPSDMFPSTSVSHRRRHRRSRRSGRRSGLHLDRLALLLPAPAAHLHPGGLCLRRRCSSSSSSCHDWESAHRQRLTLQPSCINTADL